MIVACEGSLTCRGCGHELRFHYPIGGCARDRRGGRCGCSWEGTDDEVGVT